ncbi:response regulator [Rhizobium panacihumi]|jgi:DNA-binding NtrC family response regulator|uniref:response regulator n=1 Tax=Rhizobium panacihumi TaxID=2008450 RepID=UPI0034863F73
MASQHNKPVTVLVVEDEELIRMNALDVLDDAGFIVLEAPNADLAVAVLEARDDVEIVFTDVNMPGSIDGIDLQRLVRQRWPHIGVIVTSGMVRLASGSLTERDVFFPKPYDHRRLVDSIEALARAEKHY